MSAHWTARVRGAWCVAAGLVLLTSCGVPGGGTVRQVEGDAVPYRLLDPSPTAPQTSAQAPPPGPAPLVFWSVGDRLAASPTGLSCSDDSAEVVEQLLDLVVSGPPDDERAAGRSTALPPESDVRLVAVDDGVAEVEIDTATPVSAEFLPLTVGQIVLATTTAPGVGSVLLVVDGAAVPVPRPGGALTTEPVVAADYGSLLSSPDLISTTGCGG